MRGILFHEGIFHLPRLSPTMFDPVANSVRLRAHLCTAVYSMRRKSWVRNCSRERKGMYNGNVQQNPLCAASCFHLFPVLAYVFLSRANPAPYSAPFLSTVQPKLMHLLCTAVLIGSILKTLCLKLFMRRVVVVVFFTLLTDRASTIPSNIRGCQPGTTFW